MAPVAQHSPVTAAAEHATLVVALDAGDLAGADRDRALALAAACAGCASLLGDLAAIRAATAALPAPARRRDYRLTDADAARLRPSPWRRFVHWLGAPQSTVRPFAGALATLGIAGLLLGATPGLFGQAATTASTAAAPLVAPNVAGTAGSAADGSTRIGVAPSPASGPAAAAGVAPAATSAPGIAGATPGLAALPAPSPAGVALPAPSCAAAASRSPARAPWRFPRRARPQSRFPRPRPPPPASDRSRWWRDRRALGLLVQHRHLGGGSEGSALPAVTGGTRRGSASHVRAGQRSTHDARADRGSASAGPRHRALRREPRAARPSGRLKEADGQRLDRGSLVPTRATMAAVPEWRNRQTRRSQTPLRRNLIRVQVPSPVPSITPGSRAPKR